jgi:hypothetical protein
VRTTSRKLAGYLAAAVCLIAAAPVAAWSPQTQAAIAREAARFAPVELRAELARYDAWLAFGAAEPLRDRDPLRHSQNDDGSGRLGRALVEEVEGAVAAIRARRSWPEIVRRLGRVAHWAADANNPLNASAADREERRYFRDFALYAEAARPRFVLVAYAAERPLPTQSARAASAALLRDALARGRRFYPAIGREYRRIGWGTGTERFDDRSTAFAVAALAHGHAVNDVGRLYRHVWRAARAEAPHQTAQLAQAARSSVGAAD